MPHKKKKRKMQETRKPQLKVIFTGFGEQTVEEHAQEAVRRIMKQTANPWAPMIPARNSALIQHECEGWDEENNHVAAHKYWATQYAADYLCPKHREMQMAREKQKEAEEHQAQLAAAEATGRSLGEALDGQRAKDKKKAKKKAKKRASLSS